MRVIRKWLWLSMIIAFLVMIWQPALSQQAPFRSKVGDTEFSISAFPLYQCKSSKGFGQMRCKNKRGFQVPNTLSQMFKQPLMSNYTFYADALYFS